MPGTKSGRTPTPTEYEIALIDPELEDAQLLRDSLDPKLVEALTRAKTHLPGEAGKEAARSDLLNMQVRHQLIVRLKAQGMRDDRIARAVGVSRRTVERVVKGYWDQKKLDLDQEDMDSFVLLMAEGYLEDIDRLTDLVRASTHSSAIVGAIKARQEAREKYVNLLADFGFLQRKPTEVDVHLETESTQNVLVVDPEVMRMYTKELLAQRRIEAGEDPDAAHDDDLADFIVQSDHATEAPAT